MTARHTRKQHETKQQQPAAKAVGPRPRRVNPSEIIERGIPGFSMLKYTTKLNYYDTISLSTGASSAVGNAVYSANGCFDPDITGTGHQPMAFDQMMLSFEYYCVTRSKITATFQNPADNTISVALSLQATATPLTNAFQLVENGTLVRDRLNVLRANNSLLALELPASISKFSGVPDLIDNPDYKGTISTNPVEQVYYHISAWDPFTATSRTCNVEFFIQYEVTFFEPRKNGLSEVMISRPAKLSAYRPK